MSLDRILAAQDEMAELSQALARQAGDIERVQKIIGRIDLERRDT